MCTYAHIKDMTNTLSVCSQKVSLKERVFSSPRSSGTKGKGSPQNGEYFNVCRTLSPCSLQSFGAGHNRELLLSFHRKLYFNTLL